MTLPHLNVIVTLKLGQGHNKSQIAGAHLKVLAAVHVLSKYEHFILKNIGTGEVWKRGQTGHF